MKPPVKKQPAKNNRKRLWIAGIAAAVVIAAGAVSVGFWKSRHNRIDLSGKDPNEIREFFRSDQFRNMDRQQRREIMGGAFQQVMYDNAKAYCSLPKEQQTAYLDKLIDQQETMRQEFMKRMQERQADPNRPRPNFADRRQRQGSPDGQNQQQGDSQRQRGQGRGSRTRDPERGRARSERMDPDTRAQMSAFMSAMRQRRLERGIPGGGRSGR